MTNKTWRRVFSSLIKCSSLFLTLKLSAGDGSQGMPCHNAKLLSFLVFENFAEHTCSYLTSFFIVISPLHKDLFALEFS